MKKIFIAIGLFLSPGVLLACMGDGSSGDLLCAGTYILDQNKPENRLVILGIDSRAGNTSIDLNFRDLGFVGNGIDHIDPKFLLAVNGEGVSAVYSFEIPRAFTKETENFPPRLADLKHNKIRAISRFTEDNLLKFGGRVARFSGIPMVGMPLIGTYLFNKQRQNLRDREGAELSEWVFMALPPNNKLPGFKNALSSDPIQAEYFLKKLGGDLLVRYHPKSKFRGLFVPTDDPASFYQSFRQFLTEKRNHDMQKFFGNMDPRGLVVKSLNSEMSMVFIDLHAPFLPEKYVRTIQKHMGAEFFNQRRQESLLSSESYLVPYFMISLVNTRAPVDLFFFMNPGKTLHRVLKKAYLKLAKDVGFSMIPTGPIIGPVVGAGTMALDLSLKLAVKKGAFPQLLKRVESYGVLRAMTETRSLDFSMLKDISFSVFEKDLRYFKIPEDKIQSFARMIGTARQSEALNDILWILATENEIRGRLIISEFAQEKSEEKYKTLDRLRNYLSRKAGHALGSETQDQLQAEKEELTLRLSRFLSDQKSVSKLNSKLDVHSSGYHDHSFKEYNIGKYFCHP